MTNSLAQEKVYQVAPRESIVPPFRIHMMTAALCPGDAICNYITTLVSIFRGLGCDVTLYADHPNVRFPVPHHHTSMYQSRGGDILWFHYSIYSDNLHWIRDSNDYVILDSHNVCPATFFSGYDPHLEHVCREGERLLDTFAADVDMALAHTDYVRHDLEQRGYYPVRKVPLVVDTARFTGNESDIWTPLLRHLSYLLFVGRIVPQKDIAAMLRVFAALRQRRPDLKLFLLGGQPLPSYVQEMRALAVDLGVEDDAFFVGAVTEPEVLTSFYRHAQFYLALSKWESFCVPMIESLYFGTPVAGHDVPPIPETMNGGGIVLCGEPAAMAAQIDQVWEDQAAYELLQRNGRIHAQHFTDATLRAALLSVFQAIAESSELEAEHFGI